MLNVLNVLVSGCAGDIGIAVGRILNSENVSRVIGCDIISDHIGECVFDSCFLVPRADDPNYFIRLKKILENEKISLFIPSSEAELSVIIASEYLSEDNHLFGIPVLIANKVAVRVGLDKYETVNFLKEKKIPVPWCNLAGEGPLELPCIYKPKSGQGSKGLEVVTKSKRAKELSEGSKFVWQELLLPNEEEYTCGVFRTRTGVFRCLSFRRVLEGGFTSKGIVVENPEIDHYLKQVSEALGVIGAINVQLRMTEKGPVLFEINPRFSSTVMFRHKLGFRDLIWSIQDRFEGTVEKYIAPASGTRFFRGYTEYIV